MASPLAEIGAKAELDSLPGVLELISQAAGEAGMGPGPCASLELAAEEIFVNIVNYAYGDQPGEVTVGCSLAEDGLFEIVFSDQGAPFNPLQAPDPDLSSDLAHRQIGGLGISLVRELSDRVSYTRQDHRNHLIIGKRIA